MIWSIVQSVGGQAVTALVYVLLAALLTPEDFGLIGLATVWTALLAAFAESGFGAALIQRRDIDAEHASTTFAVNVTVGIALAAVGAAMSAPVAAWFGEPRLQPVVAVLSTGFALRALGLTHMALAQRHLRFRGLAVRDVVANTMGGLVGLALALRGAGVWSLVAVSLVSAAVGSALVWFIDPWRPSLRGVSAGALRELWRFSSSILAFNLFKAIAQNVDRVIISQLLGTAAVGFYTLASRLVVQALAVPVGALGVWLFPKVARLQDDRNAVHRSYRSVLALCLAIAVPYAVVAARLAGPVVPLVLGPQWLPVVPLVGWLGIVAVARAVYSPAAQLMKALGRPDLMLRWSIAITALTVGALFAGAGWGLTGVVAGFAIAHVLGLPITTLMVARLSGFGVADHLRAAARAIGAGTLAAVALALVASLAAANAWIVVGSALAAGGALGGFLLASEPGLATRLREAFRPGRSPEDPLAG